MIRENKRGNTLVDVIENNPGIQFREIMRTTGMKNGVLSHHLGKLEKSGIVQVQRGVRQTRYYSLDVTEDQSKVIVALRRDTQRKIIHTLMVNKEGLEFMEIVSNVSKAPSTVSLYLSQLIDDDIVQLYLEERKRKYRIKDRQSVDKLIEDYHPGILDRPVSGFEDVFNSL
jgi:predicted transcriptional regulator